jgi:hypothetical protein
VTATAVTHDFQTDALADAAANAVVEGNDATFPALTPTTRLTNTCQIMAKYLMVSGTQDVVNKAGRKRELAYQLMKKSKELARDMEYGVLRNAAVETGNFTTARTFKGMAGWITTNETDKSAAALTQPDIDAAMQTTWTEGGEPSLLVCHGFNKRKIAGFVTSVTRNIEGSSNKLVNNIDVYEAPVGGMLTVVPDHFIATDDVFIIDPDLWALAYLRRARVEKLAKTGDAAKRQIIVEFTVESRQEKGNASIINTTTS